MKWIVQRRFGLTCDENNYKDEVKNDSELVQWINGRNDPEKATEQIDDSSNILARLVFLH